MTVDILPRIASKPNSLKPTSKLPAKSFQIEQFNGSLPATPIPSDSPASRGLADDYHKMKLNYFRRIKVIPILSQQDMLEAIETENGSGKAGSAASSKKSTVTSGGTKSKKVASKADGCSQRFISSFRPSVNQVSLPIAIPQRSRKTSSSPSMHEVEKGETLYSSSSFKPASMVPDHFGIFFPTFEL